jgi:hypothetical protein
MTSFNSSRVKVGVGTLYAAPLASTEPTSVTAAWPSAWQALGYTDVGSTFDITPDVVDVMVEEEYWPVASNVQGYKGTVKFNLAEVTASNLVIALNGGLTPSAAVQGTNTDGSIWVEPPDVGLEVKIMLGWDALPKGGVAGDAFGRYIFRQCLQSGAVSETHRKGNNKLMYACSFMLLKPPTQEPFRAILPAILAS